MISVKATKPAEPQGSDAAQTYRNLQGDTAPHSRVPSALGLALASIVIYLKSLFANDAAAEAATPPAGEDAPQSAGMHWLAAETEQPADGRGPADDERPAASAEAPLKFLSVESQLLDYDQLPFQRFPSPIIETSGKLNAGNDNGGSATAPSPGAGGGASPPAAGGAGEAEGAVSAEDAPREGKPPVTEEQRNRAPRVSGPVQLSDIAGCQTLMIASLALLAGATDADADPLTVTGLQASHGQLTRTEEGWVFKPQADWFGTVTLRYQVSDGETEVQQTAVLRVVENLEIKGTEGDDFLTGSECADGIDGLGGNDTIDARARMRFSAFDRNATPEVPGKLVHLSPATARDTATGQSYYVGEVEIDDVDAFLGGRKLLPGMPVEVFITTEDRTALSYLVKPLTDHAARMFRER